jgi:putative ABC transport system substrate-binding protein
VIGFMNPRAAEESAHLIAAFESGLKEGGFVQGQNVAIEFRWARGDYARLPRRRSRRPPGGRDHGGRRRSLAARGQPRDLDDPDRVGLGGDPVAAGLVESFNRPGDNMTGVTVLMDAKRLGLLRELARGVPRIGVLVNPTFPPVARQLQQLEEAARAD